MWWHLKWYPADDSAALHRLSNTDVLVAGVLVSIFVSLCLVLLLINWAQGEITKEDEAQLLQHFIRSIQINVPRQNSSLPESDVDSEEDEDESKLTLVKITEALPSVEESDESILSNSCSQVMLRNATFGKAKKGNRSNSAPSRKKSK